MRILRAFLKGLAPRAAAFALYTASVAALSAGPVSFGVRGGLPFGDAFEAVKTGQIETVGKNRFLLGPTVELRLPAGVGFNFDILYRRFAFETRSPSGTLSDSGGQWEFPLMFRYRFPGVIVRPFVAAGPVFHKITGVTAVKDSTSGMAFGAGLDIKTLVHITPEIRYSHRFQEASAGPLNRMLKANSNQWDIVVGITF
ncbi:MAG: outer membrane beta-barrel protein [Acidobacteria bacterium]|nr:outer membrane beta-barrel protein [Acidobacteriota bacterium]